MVERGVLTASDGDAGTGRPGLGDLSKAEDIAEVGGGFGGLDGLIVEGELAGGGANVVEGCDVVFPSTLVVELVSDVKVVAVVGVTTTPAAVLATKG